MHVRRGALRAEKHALRLRLVPLPDVPTPQRRAGHGVRQRAWPETVDLSVVTLDEPGAVVQSGFFATPTSAGLNSRSFIM
jgi:hypothetical protein